MYLSAIDLGTNTLRVLILNYPDQIVFRKNYYLFLGNYIVDGRLSLDGLERLKDALLQIRDELNRYNVEQTFAVATAFARKISYDRELKAVFKDILGCELRIIDGDTEGKIVLKSIYNWFKKESFMVIDMGGGSTEFSLKRGNNTKIVSLDIGSLIIKEMFFKHYPPNNEEKEALYSYLMDKLKFININLLESELVFGVGGTITTIAFLLSGLKYYDNAKINGYVITREHLERFCHKIEYVSMDELKEIFPLENGREKVLLSGSLFLLVILHYFELKSIIASDYSLLEGIIPYYIE